MVSSAGHGPGHRCHDQARPAAGAGTGGTVPSGSTVEIGRCATPHRSSPGRRRDQHLRATLDRFTGNRSGTPACPEARAATVKHAISPRGHFSSCRRRRSYAGFRLQAARSGTAGASAHTRAARTRADSHRGARTARARPAARILPAPGARPVVARRSRPCGRIAMYQPDAPGTPAGLSEGSTAGNLRPDR